MKRIGLLLVRQIRTEGIGETMPSSLDQPRGIAVTVVVLAVVVAVGRVVNACLGKKTAATMTTAAATTMIVMTTTTVIVTWGVYNQDGTAEAGDRTIVVRHNVRVGTSTGPHLRLYRV